MASGGELRERLTRLGSRRRGVTAESAEVRAEIAEVIREIQALEGGDGVPTMGEAAALTGYTRQGLYALIGAEAA